MAECAVEVKVQAPVVQPSKTKARPGAPGPAPSDEEEEEAASASGVGGCSLDLHDPGPSTVYESRLAW